MNLDWICIAYLHFVSNTVGHNDTYRHFKNEGAFLDKLIFGQAYLSEYPIYKYIEGLYYNLQNL